MALRGRRGRRPVLWRCLHPFTVRFACRAFRTAANRTVENARPKGG